MMLLLLFCCNQQPDLESASARGAKKVGEVALLAEHAERIAKELEADCDHEVTTISEKDLEDITEKLESIEQITLEIQETLHEIEMEAKLGL